MKRQEGKREKDEDKDKGHSLKTKHEKYRGRKERTYFLEERLFFWA